MPGPPTKVAVHSGYLTVLETGLSANDVLCNVTFTVTTSKNFRDVGGLLFCPWMEPTS